MPKIRTEFKFALMMNLAIKCKHALLENGTFLANLFQKGISGLSIDNQSGFI